MSIQRFAKSYSFTQERLDIIKLYIKIFGVRRMVSLAEDRRKKEKLRWLSMAKPFFLKERF